MSFVSFCFILPVLFFFVFMGSGCGSGVKEGKRSPGVGWDGCSPATLRKALWARWVRNSYCGPMLTVMMRLCSQQSSGRIVLIFHFDIFFQRSNTWYTCIGLKGHVRAAVGRARGGRLGGAFWGRGLEVGRCWAGCLGRGKGKTGGKGGGEESRGMEKVRAEGEEAFGREREGEGM